MHKISNNELSRKVGVMWVVMNDSDHGESTLTKHWSLVQLIEPPMSVQDDWLRVDQMVKVALFG